MSGSAADATLSPDGDALETDDASEGDATTETLQDPFVGRFECMGTVAGEGVPAGLSPVPIVIFSTNLGDGRVSWHSPREPGKGGSQFTECKTVLRVEGSLATLEPADDCPFAFTSGAATLEDDGGFEADLVVSLPGLEQHTLLTCDAPTPAEEESTVEGAWSCTGTVSGGTGAKELSFEATLSRPTPTTVQLNSGKGIAGPVAYCAPQYAMQDETHGTLEEGWKCGLSLLGNPTGGELTITSPNALSGTLQVDGPTIGSATFACTR